MAIKQPMIVMEEVTDLVELAKARAQRVEVYVGNLDLCGGHRSRARGNFST